MQDNSAVGRAVAIVKDLRRRCPWDRALTRETLRPYLIEEAFELSQALADGEPEAIKDEVSDLLLHLAWQLVMGEEKGEFSADDIAERLERKMKRRHPHLFDLGAPEPWEQIKRKEKRRGTLDGLPRGLPDLLMAYRLQERAAQVGFDWPDTTGPIEKIREELTEVEHALRGTRAEPAPGPEGPLPHHHSREELIEEIGDLLFAVVNLARKARVQPSLALERGNRKFKLRFEEMEKLARERGIEVATAGLEVLDGLWEEAKRSER